MPDGMPKMERQHYRSSVDHTGAVRDESTRASRTELTNSPVGDRLSDRDIKDRPIGPGTKPRSCMSIHLTRDLESLHQHIMSMCAVVEEVVHRALEELGRPDVDVSQQIVDRDDEIDRWDVRIEEECLKILALHQPVADNLRRVTAVMKIAWELERVADVAVNIAERAAGLAE